MISKINIDQFGKFKNAGFALGPVTVFYGKNEAGKTTLFDALFFALCAPGRNIKQGKNLHARYGGVEECRVSLERDGQEDQEEYDPAGFLDLYAVRESDIKLEPEQNSAWLQRLKSNLFSGGIDPTMFTEHFKKAANDTNKGFVHNRNLAKLRDERERCDQERQALITKKENLLAQEASSRQSEGANKKLEEEIEALRHKLAKLKQEIAIEDRIIERKKHGKILEEIAGFESINTRLQALDLYKADAKSEISSIEDELKVLSEQAEKMKAQLVFSQNELQKVNASMETLEEELRHINGYLNVSITSKSKIEDHIERQSRVQRAHWDMRLILLAVGIFIAGLVLEFFLHLNIIAFIAAIIAVVTALFARKMVNDLDPQKECKLIEEIKSEVSLRTGSLIALSSTTLESMKSEIYQKIDLQIDLKTQQRNERSAELKQRREDVKEKENLLVEANAALKAKNDERQKWFDRHNVRYRDEYVARREQYVGLLKEKAGFDKRLGDMVLEAGIKDLNVLKMESERRLRLLDEENVPYEGKSDLEIRQLKAQQNKDAEHLKILEDRSRIAERDLASGIGRVAGGLADIPEKIVECEKKIGRLDKEIDGITTDIKAAGMLCEIFSTLSGNVEGVLGRLSDEVAAQFGSVIPAWNSVKVQQLDQESILVNDALGAQRRVDQLSTGARESFIFGLRLVLALRSADNAKKHILVFDEPFRSFDPEKEKNILKMLKKFYDDHGWQLVFFTFDQGVVNNLTDQFGNSVTVHHL